MILQTNKQNKEQIFKMSCTTYDQRYSLDFFLLNNHKRQQLRINCLFDITYIRRTRQYTYYISVLNVAFKVNINPVSILEVRVGCSRITPIIGLYFSHVTIVCVVSGHATRITNPDIKVSYYAHH